MMSEGDERKSILIKTAKILMDYLDTITFKDLSLSEENARAVSEVALTINTILRDLYHQSGEEK